MPVPGYLTYFIRQGQTPFQVLSDLDEQVAEEILTQDILWRGDGTYLARRKRHERLLREAFVAKGGRPQRRYPIYLILGDSPVGPHSMEAEYDYRIRVPLDAFSADDASFTYPDSLYEVPLDDLGRLYLERNEHPTVYRVEDLPWVVSTYRVYEFNYHYVEAQVWNETPLLPYVDRGCWQPCK
jgi:hypothetical protein